MKKRSILFFLLVLSILIMAFMLFACDSNKINHEENNNEQPPVNANSVIVNYYDKEELLKSFIVDKSIIDLGVVPEFNIPDKEGYTNGGWYYKAKNGKSFESIDYGFAFNYITSDKDDNKVVNVYAIYDLISYDITFKMDNDYHYHYDNYAAFRDGEKCPIKYTIEDEFSIPDFNEEWFDHWETADGKTITKISKGTVGDLVITAKQKMCKVTFKDWDGTILDEKSVPKDSHYRYKNGSEDWPTRVGTTDYYYKFTGWDPFSYDDKVTEDLEFTATYEQVYYLVFELIENDTEYALKKCNITEGDIVIPSEYNGLPVTRIYSSAFYGYTNVKSVTLPSSLKSIDDAAFSNYNALTSIVIPEGVKALYRVFNGCANLEKVTLPSSISYMYEPIKNCPKLKTAGPIGGGYNVEYAWTESLPYHAFDIDTLEKVVVPASITTIGQEAFKAPKLKTAGPIGGGYNIEFGWTDEIPERAFAYSNIQSITLPNTITKINKNAFYYASHLYSIVIPASVTALDSSAFSYCWQLVEIFNLSSCNLHKPDAIHNSHTLSDSKIVKKESGIYYVDGTEKYLIDYDGDAEELVIDNDTTNIYDDSLTLRYKVKTIVIPTSVVNIGNKALELVENINYKGTQAQWDAIEKAYNSLKDGVNITFLGDVT